MTDVHDAKGLLLTRPPAVQHQASGPDHNSTNSISNDNTDFISNDNNSAWHVRCNLFGHAFYAELPPSTISTSAVDTTTISSANCRGSKKPMATAGGTAARAGLSTVRGVESHAYIQCGISRLRHVLGGGDRGHEEDCVIEVELWVCDVERGRDQHEHEDSARYRCKVRYVGRRKWARGECNDGKFVL